MSAHSSSGSATGFSFKNCFRNTVLEKRNNKAPEPYKTGTTISGVVFEGGVVLGADTRATIDTLVIDGYCHKIHFLAKNIYCCGAGTTADIEAVTRLMSSNLELMRLESGGRLPRVRCATRMMKQMLFRYGGEMSAALIIGGVDATGPHISCVQPHGSSSVLPFATMGSGGLAAMAVLEAGFKEKMTRDDAKRLVKESILAGINNDLGSGSVIRLRVIEADHSFKRKQTPATMETEWHQQYTYEPGTTAILEETREVLKLEVVDDQRFPIDKDEDSDEDSD